MSRTRTVSNKLYGIEKRLFMGLLCACVLLSGLYVYFVGKSIVNVVVREEIELRIGEINSHLSDLEGEYLSKKDTINLGYAEERGFLAVSKKSFVTRTTLVGRTLSQNNEI